MTIGITLITIKSEKSRNMSNYARVSHKDMPKQKSSLLTKEKKCRRKLRQNTTNKSVDCIKT